MFINLLWRFNKAIIYLNHETNETFLEKRQETAFCRIWTELLHFQVFLVSLHLQINLHDYEQLHYVLYLPAHHIINDVMF